LRRLACAVLALALAGCATPKSYFLPGRGLVANIDYSGWDALLREHVSEGRVDYAAFARSDAFRDFLRLLQLTRLTVDATREQRLAFWLNAYNARAIAAVVSGSRPDSRFGRWRFFRYTRHAVGGEEITLWDLEHERIRPMGEARIHFALACASVSCPRLAAHAYRPEALDAQLEQAALDFLNDAERNRFDAGAREAWLSRIFEWYALDFVGAAGSIAAYVAPFVRDPEVAGGLAGGGYRVQYLEWDWSLNGPRPPEG
jgi:hypothetical protein